MYIDCHIQYNMHSIHSHSTIGNGREKIHHELPFMRYKDYSKGWNLPSLWHRGRRYARTSASQLYGHTGREVL